MLIPNFEGALDSQRQISARNPNTVLDSRAPAQQVKSSDIFIRDSSCVSDYALLLFGGALSAQGSTLSMCNGYASFSASRDVNQV